MSDRCSPVVGSSNRKRRGFSAFRATEKARQFESLRLAARQSRGRLTEPQVTQAYSTKSIELADQGAPLRKHLHGALDG